MRQFLKFFLAAFLALIIFTVIGIFIMAGWIGSIASSKTVETGSKAILYIDASKHFPEQSVENPLASLSKEDDYSVPGLFDAVRLIRHAKSDSAIKGIYLKIDDNNNGFASTEELRNAIIDFKSAKKFVIAYGDVISQKAYYLANVADKIYCNPKGSVEWKGFAIEYTFFKNALDKLEIEPQIFYAGKFKSATEPFRAEKMSDPNKVQSLELIRDIYQQLLRTTSESRKIDTATLHRYANEYSIRFATDAAKYKLIDAAIYDDEVKDELRTKIGIEKTAAINFVDIGKYAEAVNYKTGKGTDKVALIFAEGNIVDGKGSDENIGGDRYRTLIRKARLDKTVKAIVFRVNSGGGSALASENMWRELTMARKEKPVIMSFGDVAASGGYYLACNADSIFAQPNTITGSIGVFSIIPNMSGFFKDKLGVTFDGVKTAEHADIPTASKPLSAVERTFFQNDVDSIYHTFLTRVSEGRKLSYAFTDSIAQGRVWMGERALRLGLVDRIGNLQDAIDCASRMAKIKEYRVREFPEPTNIFDRIFGRFSTEAKAASVKEELGDDGYKIYNSLRREAIFN